jgi:hypothetical protein
MAESPDSSTQLQLLLQTGLELPAEKKFYFNGFAVVTSPSDVIITLLQNNRPIALLYTSHGTAKTLVTKVGTSLTDLEEKTGQQILTLDQIASAISKSKEP